MKITLKAPAKINLFLEITSKRPDGYHNLQTIMQTVSLYDELTFEDLGGADQSIILECSSKELPVDESNLIYKAALAVRKFYNINRGVKIFLQKEIPTGAGLGGGSSDAAAAIKGLVHIWGIEAKKADLEKIAAQLGSDVPFFITGGTALCEGRGEIVTPLPAVLGMPVILVNPGFGVATASVYKKVAFPLTKPRKIHRITKLICEGSFGYRNASDYCFNRLEEFVFPDYPQIKKIKRVLTELGCASFMSGSGATIFGIFDSESQSETIKSKLQMHQCKTWAVLSSGQ
ncbi:MAG: 4-(cytidine 5'-diphospho)-2-C-methyl-D-erythritol kinase [Endomicrobia bacterium]|nr:4-(cytidine 5'-diphospho)-2-C-methyl-D-erythritol kinase [Endomicrobiia bacterium]